MKIAFFVSGFPELSETFIVNQIMGLVDRGHEVQIYADKIHAEAVLHAEYHKYHLLERTQQRRSVTSRSWVLKLSARLGLALKNVWRHPLVVFRAMNVFAYGRRAVSMHVLDLALRFVNQPSYDIIHCHFGTNGNDAAILIELGLLKGRLVTTFHGHDIRQGIASSGKIYARLARYCDAVHSISEYNRRWLEAFGFDPARIIHHPIGIDITRFQPRGGQYRRTGNDEPVTIVTVARLVEEKGLGYALEALADVRKQRPHLAIRYRILGGGPLENSLRAQAKQLALDDVVEFMGPQDQAIVRSVLAQADLFLLPSVAEALPVSIMEAMACGLPVVATEVGSVAELVKGGQTGRLVPPADSKALARALLEMFDGCESWSKLGSAGRTLVAQRFDVEILNDRLVEHYRWLLNHESISTVGVACSID